MINYNLHHITILLLASILSACAVNQVPPDFTPESDDKNGVVVFSVSHDLEGGARNNAIIYLNTNSFGTSEGIFESSADEFLRPRKESDYVDVYGHLYAILLPAGDYAFTSWQIFNGAGLRILAGKGTQPQPFHVDAGQVKYLGNLHGNLRRGKNFLGMTITGGGVISVNNMQERDIKLLITRYPQYQNIVKIDTLRLGPWIGSENTKMISEIPFQLPVPK